MRIPQIIKNKKYKSFLDYSLDEIYTGVKWIDGSKIYRKYVSINNPKSIPSGSITDNDFPHNIPNLKEVINIINPRFVSTMGTYYFPILSTSGNMTVIKEANSQNIVIRSGKETWSTLWTLKCTLEYTKNE